MIVYKVPDALASQYKGAGWALAAIADSQPVKLVYLTDCLSPYAPPNLDQVESGVFLKYLLGLRSMQPTLQDLQSLGQVRIVMLSCWEVCVL